MILLPKPIRMAQLLEKIQIYLKLKWVYETETIEAKALRMSNLSENLERNLPSAEVTTLLKFAQKGDIKRIRNHLTYLEEIDPKVAPVVVELRRLADRYRIKQIRELLNSCRD